MFRVVGSIWLSLRHLYLKGVPALGQAKIENMESNLGNGNPTQHTVKVLRCLVKLKGGC